MAASAGEQVLISATADTTDGVFTADVAWTLQVTGVASNIDLLPDRAAQLFAATLPIQGSPYPGHPFATCRTFNCKTTDKKRVFLYSAKFSDENSTDEQGTNENPLLDRPITKPIANIVKRVISRDRDGYGILNSAGDPIKQTKDDNTIGWQVSANIAAVPNYLGALRNTCNSGPITIGGMLIADEAGRFILPQGWLSDRKTRNDVNYYVFSYEIWIDEEDTHYGRPLDAGFRQLYPASDGDGGFTTELGKIVEKDGSEPSEPVPLDAGYKIDNPTPETVGYLTVKKYPAVSYYSLPGVS